MLNNHIDFWIESLVVVAFFKTFHYFVVFEWISLIYISIMLIQRRKTNKLNVRIFNVLNLVFSWIFLSKKM